MVFDLAYIGYFHASHTQIYYDTVKLRSGCVPAAVRHAVRHAASMRSDWNRYM